ncbi:hypothetical protein B0T14DRAFT_528956 [Immersiella caudata]|uniref:Uncharacterized protein n=1 Tax=Immersiella caudata TaxID=314043 RepID=A0AA40BV46_9PEZI|nr:hypothetical protein B0T14DRAFT_528956 [Immersiella caudata]
MRLVALFALGVLPFCQGTPLTVTTTASELAIPSPSLTPAPKETDICLQRKFLSAPYCIDQYPGWTNVVLSAAGFHCCWEMPMPVEGNPKLSAWLKYDENGDVAYRCLYSGTCLP